MGAMRHWLFLLAIAAKARDTINTPSQRQVEEHVRHAEPGDNSTTTARGRQEEHRERQALFKGGAVGQTGVDFTGQRLDRKRPSGSISTARYCPISAVSLVHAPYYPPSRSLHSERYSETRRPSKARRAQRSALRQRELTQRETPPCVSGRGRGSGQHQTYRTIETALTSRNSSIPMLPFSRPRPLSLKPPKGICGAVGTGSLIPTIP